MEINFDVKDIFRMSSVKKSVRFFTSDGIYKKYTWITGSQMHHANWYKSTPSHQVADI